MNGKKSATVIAGAVLLAITSVLSIVLSIPFLSAGPAAAAEIEGPPYFIIILGLVMGVVGLVAAGGLWMSKAWGKWLGIVVSVINALSAAPGVAFAPTPDLKVEATLGVALSVIIIVLLLLPTRQRAATESE